MRLPSIPGRRRPTRGADNCLEAFPARVRGLVEYYSKSRGVGDSELAVAELVEKGYNYWILEQRYGGDKVERAWASSDLVAGLAAGYAFYRLRLRDAVEELRRLTLTLSGVLADPETVH